MLFNSGSFVLFFGVVYGIYLALGRSYRLQNWWLLGSSYFFYGFWDWRFVFLLAGTTTLQFNMAKAIAGADDPRQRRLLTTLSVIASLTILGFFKYFNFFESGLLGAVHLLGLRADPVLIHLVLPVGMSFYTFKEISYVVDVSKKKRLPAERLDDFALYVSFFPQLVAGPIERSSEMLPQIGRPRQITAERVEVGIYLITWGLFKKMVVADNLKPMVDAVYGNVHHYAGLDVALAMLAYSFQIYCDFSGYSDIARGLASLMGFHLPLNFRLPYFAKNPSEFWQRWHITLSQWLRDYLYIPLGGNRGGESKTLRNLMITMLLGGLWHGAAWNFIFWGGFHGLLLCLHRMWTRLVPLPRSGPLTNGLSMALMFGLTTLGWVFFRATSAGQIAELLTHVGFGISSETGSLLWKLSLLLVPLLLVEVYQEYAKDLLVFLNRGTVTRIALLSACVILLLVFGVRGRTEFIYFQF